jgi:hypothetical protein
MKSQILTYQQFINEAYIDDSGELRNIEFPRGGDYDFDMFEQGNGWSAYQGANDWESGTTGACVYIGPEGYHREQARIWFEVQYPKELSELVAILGLDINDPNSVDNMTYGGVATLTDADHDGAGHISPLIIAFFYKFWPRLLSEKRIHVTRSPIMISTNGKDTKWFFTYEEANEFKSDSKGYTHRYIKGLGSLTENEYDRVINDPMLDTITVDDANYFQVMFGNDVSLRKEIMTQ